KAVLGGGAVAEVGLGVEPLDGLGHDVGGGVAQNVQFFFLGALGDGAVVVDDLHDRIPFSRSMTERKQKSASSRKSLHGMKRRYVWPESSTVPPELHRPKGPRLSLRCNGRARQRFASALRGGRGRRVRRAACSAPHPRRQPSL